MRKEIATLALTLAMGALAGAPALADVSTTHTLPAKACNQGTMNAHNHIPPQPVAARQRRATWLCPEPPTSRPADMVAEQPAG
jgi:hypothetical protein